MGTFASEAARYFERGMNVLPVVPVEKRAVVPWKPWYARRQRPDEVQRLIREHPDADIAVVTGRVSGIVDIETDGPEGEQALKDLMLPLPPTASFESARSKHLLYGIAREIPSRPGVGPKLDVLAGKRYVVVPPSVGRTWLTSLADLAPLPGEWVEFVLREARRAEGRSLIEADQNGATEGQRNGTLTRLVGRWLTQGLTEEVIIRRAVEWAGRCTLPMDQREAMRVVESIVRTRKRQRSDEAKAMFLAGQMGLSLRARSLLVGLVVLWGELGRLDRFAAPYRVIRRLSGVDMKFIRSSLEELSEANLIDVFTTTDPTSGKPETGVCFIGEMVPLLSGASPRAQTHSLVSPTQSLGHTPQSTTNAYV